MGYRKITAEILINSDDTEVVIQALNDALDKLEPHVGTLESEIFNTEAEGPQRKEAQMGYKLADCQADLDAERAKNKKLQWNLDACGTRCRKLDDKVEPLRKAMDILDNPAAYGCTLDLGDAATYQDRVGRIVDEARKAAFNR
jgi:hypothetical protein